MKTMFPRMLAFVFFSIAFHLLSAHIGMAADDDEAPAGKPIPDAHAAPYFREICGKWWIRTVIDEYNKTPKADPKVAAFMQKAVVYMYNPTAPSPTREELQAEAIALRDAGADDPGFLYLGGTVQGNVASQKEFFTKSLEGLPKSPYPKFLQFMASASLGKVASDTGAEAAAIESRDKDSLAALAMALEADKFGDEDMTPLFWRFTSKPCWDLFGRRPAEMFAIMEKSKIARPAAHFFEGNRYDKLAWEARGHEYADKLTEEQINGFNKNIALAREHYTKSWELNPGDPRAASEMISIAMCESEQVDTMRQWFDRSIAACMDFDPAYGAMAHGLLPEWGGSYKQMLGFATECLKTARYDTQVPYRYALTVKEISKKSEDNGAIFSDPQVYKNLQEMCDAYLKEAKSPIPAKYLHTLAALIAFKAGKHDEARKHLEAINYDTAKAKDWAEVQSIPEMVKALRDPAPK